MKIKLVNFLFLFFPLMLSSQQFGIKYNSAEATNGYSLFTTFSGTYLIDNCGKLVHSWNVGNVENHCKLLPNGNLLYSQNNRIREMDWNGNIVKSVTVSQNNVILDYEVVPMPNGNYICAARIPTAMSVFRAFGYTAPTSSFSLQDAVVEIDGTNGNIVWQWEILDHVVQDVDPTKFAYGNINENPRKLNINAISTFDWDISESFMINGLDYNPELDEIAISVRKLGEVVILDHSTTPLEAKGSNGGRHGHGGDAIYRYGNPQNYGRGTILDRRLYFQHNPNWIQYGEHKGKIMVFNNNLSTNKSYSSVDIIDPVKDANGFYILEDNKAFQPINPVKEYNKVTTNTNFYSGYTSGGQVLPNGNISITVGQSENLIEIDPNGKVLWNYIVQYGGYIFRTTRYPADYAAFIGKTLIPMGNVEIPASTYNCTLVGIDDQRKDSQISLKVINHSVLVEGIEGHYDYRILDIKGQIIEQKQNHTELKIEYQNITPGLYIMQLTKDGVSHSTKLFLN